MMFLPEHKQHLQKMAETGQGPPDFRGQDSDQATLQPQNDSASSSSNQRCSLLFLCL